MTAVRFEDYLADAARKVDQAVATAIRVPPPLDLEDWAVENVSFSKETGLPSDLSGTYDPKKFPFFTRPLQVLGPDDPAREVVLKKSAQLGGTVLAMIVVGGYLDKDPRDTLYTHPTEGNAKRWAKQKWRRFARKVKGLGQLFETQGSKDSGSTTLYQERHDGQGFIQISGANSEASLSMMTANLQVQDDLSKWEMNNAGDPENQADSRSSAVEFAKIFKLGTPLLKDNCKVSRAYKRSTQERYHVPCPHCRELQALEWENFLPNIDPEAPETAHFTCIHCGGEIHDRDRTWMMLPENGAKWVAENPKAPRIGFRVWSAYSPLQSFQRIAIAWLDAEGDPESEQTFYNDVLGLEYEGAGEAPPWEELRDRSEKSEYEAGTIPPGAIILAIGVDCQGDRVEWQLVGFGRERQRFVIDRGVIADHISEEKAQHALDDLLKREWPNAWGRRLPADMLAIDFNYAKSSVLDWVRRYPESRVIAVRGAKSDRAPELQLVKELKKPDGTIVKRQKRCFNVGVSPLKGYLYENLAKDDPQARGYVHFAKGLDDEYFQELTAEHRSKVKLKDGSHEYRWKKPDGQDNECLDTMLYAEGAAIRLRWKVASDDWWDRLVAERECEPDEPQRDLDGLWSSVPADSKTGGPKTPAPKAEDPLLKMARRHRGDD